MLRDWPEFTGTRLSQPIRCGPPVILTLDKNSPSKYTAGTMRTWDCTLVTVFYTNQGWRLVLLCWTMSVLVHLCFERCKCWSCVSLWYHLSHQGHRLGMWMWHWLRNLFTLCWANKFSRNLSFKSSKITQKITFFLVVIKSNIIYDVFFFFTRMFPNVNSCVVHHPTARRLRVAPFCSCMSKLCDL